MNGKWLVVRTYTRRENTAAWNLARQGYEYFLPKERTTIIRQGKKLNQTNVLFPSYIFVLIQDGRWRSLRSTIGVIQVVMTGEHPSIVPKSIMTALLKLADKDGLIKLDKPRTRFKKGQSVKPRTGPFKGIVGLYDGQSAQERERVLMDILGQRAIALEFSDGDLEAA